MSEQRSEAIVVCAYPGARNISLFLFIKFNNNIIMYVVAKLRCIHHYRKNSVNRPSGIGVSARLQGLIVIAKTSSDRW